MRGEWGGGPAGPAGRTMQQQRSRHKASLGPRVPSTCVTNTPPQIRGVRRMKGAVADGKPRALASRSARPVSVIPAEASDARGEHGERERSANTLVNQRLPSGGAGGDGKGWGAPPEGTGRHRLKEESVTHQGGCTPPIAQQVIHLPVITALSLKFFPFLLIFNGIGWSDGLVRSHSSQGRFCDAPSVCCAGRPTPESSLLHRRAFDPFTLHPRPPSSPATALLWSASVSFCLFLTSFCLTYFAQRDVLEAHPCRGERQCQPLSHG